jgi:hypothetical protein
MVIQARKCNNDTIRAGSPYFEPVCAPLDDIE